jgi:hypothetical protein
MENNAVVINVVSRFFFFFFRFICINKAILHTNSYGAMVGFVLGDPFFKLYCICYKEKYENVAFWKNKRINALLFHKKLWSSIFQGVLKAQEIILINDIFSTG